MDVLHYDENRQPDFGIREHLLIVGFGYRFVSTSRELNQALSQVKVAAILIEADTAKEGALLLGQRLRSVNSVPLFILSSDSSDSSVISAFEIGVDDYLARPLTAREIALRIRAVVRRIGKDSETASVERYALESASLEIDRMLHTVLVNGSPAHLTGTEWCILLYLADARGVVRNREQIMTHCFGYSQDSYDRIIDSHIKNLRGKLGSTQWIETIRGFGYRFTFTIHLHSKYT